MACDFCFHKAFALPFPSENFGGRGKKVTDTEDPPFAKAKARYLGFRESEGKRGFLQETRPSS